MNSRSLVRVAFWLLVAIVLYLALTPGPLASIIAGTERHYLAFLVLPAAAHYGWPRISLIVLWLGFAAFGGLIEILQFVMNLGRAAEMSDWINDMSATTIALLLSYLAHRLFWRDELA